VALLRKAGWDTVSVVRAIPTLGRGADTSGYVAMDLSGNFDTRLLPAKADAVIHLAQSPHFRRFPEKADDIFAVNTATTFHLLEYARKACASSFILASTGGVYATVARPLREDDPLSPLQTLSFYAASKLAAETVSMAYSTMFNVQALRFFFIYGLGQDASMLIPRLAASVRAGRPVIVQGAEGGMRFNPVYADDAALAVEAALLLNGGNTINVAGPQTLDIATAARQIGVVTGCEPVFDVRAGETPNHLVADISKMSRLLGNPKTTFAEGCALTLSSEFPISTIPTSCLRHQDSP
jgi:nucleoside-diphosphate-sugar epimerase